MRMAWMKRLRKKPRESPTRNSLASITTNIPSTAGMPSAARRIGVSRRVTARVSRALVCNGA